MLTWTEEPDGDNVAKYWMSPGRRLIAGTRKTLGFTIRASDFVEADRTEVSAGNADDGGRWEFVAHDRFLLDWITVVTNWRASFDSGIHDSAASGASVIQPRITRPPLSIGAARPDASNSATRAGGSFSSRWRLRVSAA